MRRLLTAALAGALILAGGGTAQTTFPRPSYPPTTPKFVPKFAVIGETKLIMEGLAHANYRSVSKLLKTKPADNDTWVFARGQAVLIAETGNLLLLRPPRNEGRDTWMKLAMSMRSQATLLAKAAGARDYVASRVELGKLTTACNNCHATFRIPVKVAPEGEASQRDL